MLFVTRNRRDASFFPLTVLQRVQLTKLATVAERLDKRAAIPATSGNFSLRINSETCFISRSGLHKRDLTPGSFLRVSLTEGSLNPIAPKASDETAVHQTLYRLLPKMNCILHCHASEIERLRAPGQRLPGHELLKALGFADHKHDLYLNTFENTQDMNELARDVERLFHGSPEQTSLQHGIFVLEQHGIYCGGTSVQNAEAKLEAILHLLTRIR